MGIDRFEQLCPRGSRGVSMSQTYHPNFKSFDRYVKTAEGMHNYVRLRLWELDRLGPMDDIQRRTTPWEIDAWNADELKSFRIDLKSIDRLYHINIIAPWGRARFNMIGRKDCDGHWIYFHLQSVSLCQYQSEQDSMNVSKDVSLFMRYINQWTPFNSDGEIDEALMEDGTRMEENPLFKMDRWVNRMDVDSLEEICYDVIFRHKQALEPRFEELPKCIANRIIKFILFHEKSLILPRLKQHKLFLPPLKQHKLRK